MEKQENNFEYVYFSDTLFLSGFTFTTDANFSYAIFTKLIHFNTVFEKPARFMGCEFKNQVLFNKSEFIDYVNFSDAVFNDKTSFLHTFFKSFAHFHYASFNEESHLSFIDSDIRESISFIDAQLKGYVSFTASPYVPDNLVFNGKNVVLDLQNAKFEKPERVSFHSVRLQPNWFINVDCRTFSFMNCFWENSDGNKINTKSELKILSERNVVSNHSLLSRACWQLADNYEENKSFRKASLFRQMANEAMRLKEYKGFKVWTLHW